MGSPYLIQLIKKVKDRAEKSTFTRKWPLELNSTIDFIIYILDEKNALENLRKEKLQGHIIRSRAQLIEQGEKPSRYFCKLGPRNFLNKTIKKNEV